MLDGTEAGPTPSCRSTGTSWNTSARSCIPQGPKRRIAAGRKQAAQSFYENLLAEIRGCVKLAPAGRRSGLRGPAAELPPRSSRLNRAHLCDIYPLEEPHYETQTRGHLPRRSPDPVRLPRLCGRYRRFPSVNEYPGYADIARRNLVR